MKKYEMKAATYDGEDATLVEERIGSEPFEAETKKKALKEAVNSEYCELKEDPDNTEIKRKIAKEFGYMSWIHGNKEYFQFITVEERR